MSSLARKEIWTAEQPNDVEIYSIHVFFGRCVSWISKNKLFYLSRKTSAFLPSETTAKSNSHRERMTRWRKGEWRCWLGTLSWYTTNRANKHSRRKDEERLWSEGTAIHKRGLSAVRGINILSWILKKSFKFLFPNNWPLGQYRVSIHSSRIIWHDAFEIRLNWNLITFPMMILTSLNESIPTSLAWQRI